MQNTLDYGTRYRTVQSPVNPIAFSSGATVAAELPKSFLYKDISIRLSGTITMSGGGSAVAGEAPLGLIQRIQLIADGRKVLFDIDGRNAYQLSRLFRGKAGELTAPAGFGVQTNTVIAASFILDSQAIRMISPVDSYFDPRPFEKVELRITWGTIGNVIVGGTGTVNAGTQADIQINQTIEGADLVQFNRLVIYDEQAIAAVSSNFQFNVPRSGLLAGLLIQSTVDGNPSDAILNYVSLKSDNNFLHIDRLAYSTLQKRNVIDFQIDGGATVGQMPTGYVYIDLTEDGMITTALNTLDLNVLQLILDVSAPGTTRLVRPAYVFYEPIVGV